MRHIFESLGLTDAVFLSLAALGLVLAITIEQAQLLAKFQGYRQARIAGGYNDAMKIMVLNRVGAVLYFIFVAISIDRGVSAARMGTYYIGAFIVICLANASVVAMMVHRFGVSLSMLRGATIRWMPVYMALASTCFSLVGLTLPMLLSTANPTMRLTLANTGFIFNSFFTVMNVFFVESYFAKLIDGDDGDHPKICFIALVFCMRSLAAVFGIFVMGLLIAYSDSLKIDHLF